MSDRAALNLGDIATRTGAELRGDPAVPIDRVASLDQAGPGAISFFAKGKYQDSLRTTSASAVILNSTDAANCPVAILVSDNPYATFARVAQLLNPVPEATPGVHPSAVVAPTAQLDPTVAIGPQAVIGEGCRIGAATAIGAGTVLGAGVTIGAATRLAARVTVCEGVAIGSRVIIHSGAVIGADGFGFANDQGVWIKIPQVGSVVIGDDVEIGANTAIDRGTLGNTVIGNGVKLDNLIQIGHNVHIGEHAIIAAHTAVAGSTRIGAYCMIAGACAIAEHLEIADGTIVTGMSMVTSSIHQKGSYSSGSPLTETRKWRRNCARLRNLDDIVRKLDQKK